MRDNNNIIYMYTHLIELHKFHKNYLCFNTFLIRGCCVWFYYVRIVHVTSMTSNVITGGGGGGGGGGGRAFARIFRGLKLRTTP